MKFRIYYPKKLIKKSYSPRSCTTFYVNKNAKKKGILRLVINYKPLNDVLKWIRYSILNKKNLLDWLYKAKIFSKFELKSSYWHIQISKKHKYKTSCTVLFSHYEWNIMPFELKNAPLEFQNNMNEIFIPHSNYCIAYIDDVLIFSSFIDQLFKNFRNFKDVIIKNGLVIFESKMKFFQTNVRFLGHKCKRKDYSY